jgi:hypothetical protein
LIPLVALSMKASPSSAPRKRATSAAAARRRGACGGADIPRLVSSRIMKRAGWRSISSRSALRARITASGVTPTVPWFR